MKEVLDHIRNKFSHDLEETNTLFELEQLKIKFFGKKSPIQELMRSLKEVSQEERPHLGKLINDLKVDLMDQIQIKENRLQEQEEKKQLIEETLDVTLPGKKTFFGSRHILTQVLDEVIDILISMGFSVETGPEIDTDYYNFASLNFPLDHPARDMQDTFYLSEQKLLRTQTSNIQVRIMEQGTPPIRVISPGKVYRNETVTARSHVFFHQVEAFYIDRDVKFGDLLQTMDLFFKKLFHQKIETQYRPSYFPFVEPGMEVDVRCLICQGEGCSICKKTGWLEVAGAGMIHPNVLKNGGIDPEEYSGYAWGLGIERLAMIRHGIRDIRLFTENDTRFLSQFS